MYYTAGDGQDLSPLHAALYGARRSRLLWKFDRLALNAVKLGSLVNASIPSIHRAVRIRLVDAANERDTASRASRFAGLPVIADAFYDIDDHGDEIGRASCRERV